MKTFKYKIHRENFTIGIVDYGGFITILNMNNIDIYTGLRIRKDKISDLVKALCCVYSGQKNRVTIVNSSPDCPNYDIVVKRSGFYIYIEQNSWTYGGLYFIDRIALPLIQLLEDGTSNGVFEVDEFIKPVYDIGYWFWIFVFNFGNRVVIAKLNEYDRLQGMTIPMSRTYTLSKKLINMYHMNGKTITNYDMANPYGRGKLILPSSDSVLFVGETLRNIYVSQKP